MPGTLPSTAGTYSVTVLCAPFFSVTVSSRRATSAAVFASLLRAVHTSVNVMSSAGVPATAVIIISITPSDTARCSIDCAPMSSAPSYFTLTPTHSGSSRFSRAYSASVRSLSMPKSRT